MTDTGKPERAAAVKDGPVLDRDWATIKQVIVAWDELFADQRDNRSINRLADAILALIPKPNPAAVSVDREGIARLIERIDRELTEMRCERFMPPWGMVGIALLWGELRNALAAGEG